MPTVLVLWGLIVAVQGDLMFVILDRAYLNTLQRNYKNVLWINRCQIFPWLSWRSYVSWNNLVSLWILYTKRTLTTVRENQKLHRLFWDFDWCCFSIAIFLLCCIPIGRFFWSSSSRNREYGWLEGPGGMAMDFHPSSAFYYYIQLMIKLEYRRVYSPFYSV